MVANPAFARQIGEPIRKRQVQAKQMMSDLKRRLELSHPIAWGRLRAAKNEVRDSLLVPCRYRSAEFWSRLRYGRAHRSKIFRRIYEANAWGDDESRSGSGSRLNQTVSLRSDLRALLEDLSIRTLLDAPCGDFNWMEAVDLRDIAYTGIDIVPELTVRNRALYGHRGMFETADITCSELPTADLILCRECLQHLPTRDCLNVLANFRSSGATWLLYTTADQVNRNTDCETGGCRQINLALSPFSLGPPLRVIREHFDYATVEMLGLWQLNPRS